MAGNIKLDLKQFKHVKSDKNTTTLQHAGGHQLVLAHKALSPEAQAQLGALSKLSQTSETPLQTDSRRDQKMADGGKVEAKQKPDDKTINYKQLVKDKKQQNHIEANQPVMPKKQYADGGDVVPLPDYAHDEGLPEQIAQQAAAAGAPAVNEYANMNLPQKVGYNIATTGIPIIKQSVKDAVSPFVTAAKGVAGLASGFDSGVDEVQGIKPEITAEDVMATKAKGRAEALAQDTVQASREAAQAQQQAAATDVAPPQRQGGGLGGDPMGMLAGGYNKAMAGITQGAEAQGQLGDKQAEILNQQIAQKEEAERVYRDQYDALEKERQLHMQDIQKGHIDPNKYWTGTFNPETGKVEGGHSKILSAIGMIIAGYDPAGHGNGAVKFLQQQMANNLDAQKQNLASDQNLLAANLRQFGNLKDATDMTRIMQNDVIVNQLQAAAAKAQSPVAKAAALAAVGKLQMDIAPQVMNLAMSQSAMKIAAGGSSNPGAIEQMIAMANVRNPELGKRMSEAFVPGVGMTKGMTPVSAEVRSQIQAHQQLDAAAQDLREWTNKNSTVVPGTPTYNVGISKAQNLQQMIRRGQLQTVYREGEQPLLDKMVNGNPAGLLKNFSTLPKIGELLDNNRKQYNILLHGYGLPVPQQAQQAPEPQYKTVNGVKYMRGPNGEAIQVPTNKGK